MLGPSNSKVDESSRKLIAGTVIEWLSLEQNELSNRNRFCRKITNFLELKPSFEWICKTVSVFGCWGNGRFIQKSAFLFPFIGIAHGILTSFNCLPFTIPTKSDFVHFRTAEQETETRERPPTDSGAIRLKWCGKRGIDEFQSTISDTWNVACSRPLE